MEQTEANLKVGEVERQLMARYPTHNDQKGDDERRDLLIDRPRLALAMEEAKIN